MIAGLGITGSRQGTETSAADLLSLPAGMLAFMTIQKPLTRIELGALGEQLAVDHLRSLGLAILGRNWRCRYGELDLIACENTTRTVIFVEVKTRSGDGYGGLAQAVTESKVRRLRRLAGLWLANQQQGWAAIRIDMIGVRIGRRPVPELTHLEGIG